MASHTQTGSIDLKATSAVKLFADGRYVDKDTGNTFATKAELEVAAGEITTYVGQVEANVDTVSNPNLTPWFSVSVDDTSYWKSLHCRNTSVTNSEGLHGIWDREEGWAHITLDGRTSAGNNGSSSCYMNMYVAVGQIQKMVKPSGKYTWMVEVRNLTFVGASSSSALVVRPSINNATLDIFSNASTSFTEDEAKYAVVTAKSDFSTLTQDTRGYCYVPTGCYADFDLRVSLYEGEYKGPYKPFVNQSLANRVKTAETSITQNAGEIALRATKTEAYQVAQPNLAPYFLMPMTQTTDDYWSNITYARFTQLADGWARFEYSNAGSSTVNNYIAPKAIGTLVPGGHYTVLVEFRNVSISATGGNFYVQQSSAAQVWGTSAYGGFSIANTDIMGLEGGEGKFWKPITLLTADSKDPSGVVRGTLPKTSFMYINEQVYAGQSISYDVRISLYEGEYAGPYKPFTGVQLYASQAELKVESERISSKVSTTDYNGNTIASLINQSADTVVIEADHIQLDGTTTFGSTTLGEHITGVAQAAADAVEVGGRNLLKWSAISSDNLQKVNNSGANVTVVTEDGYACYKAVGTSTNGYFYGSSKGASVAPVLDANTTYIYSAWIKVTTTASGVTSVAHSFTSLGHHQVYNSASTKSDKAHEDIADERIYIPSTVSIGEWTYITEQFTTNDLNGSLFGKYVKHALGADYTVFVRNWKLEKGNKATDWTPAPEDVESNTLASGIEYIEGTQTAATNLWTGVTKETALVTGKTIAYKLPYAGNSTAATLNLTLAGGGTTGAKAIKMPYSTSSNDVSSLADVKKNYPAGSIINMTYDGTQWIISNYNTNIDDKNARNVCFYNTIIAGEALAAASIIGMHTDGKFYQVKENATFDLSSPLLWLTNAVASGKTNYANIYTKVYDRVLSTHYTSFANTTKNCILYLVGTVSGNTFSTYGTSSAQYLTVTPPTTEDGRFYIPLGRLGNDSTGLNHFNFYVDTPVSLYAYLDGKFRQVTPTEIVASQRIYYRSSAATNGVGTKPNGNGLPTTWVTQTGDKYNTTATASDGWSTKVTPLASDKDASAGKYLYLWTCEQRKRLDGTVKYTEITLDENTTVIDGGQIITHSITSEQIKASSITAEEIDSENLHVSSANIDGTLTIGLEDVTGLSDKLGGYDQDLAGIKQEGVLRSQWVRIDPSGVEVAKDGTGTKVSAGKVEFLVNGQPTATAGVNEFIPTALRLGDYVLSGSGGYLFIDYDPEQSS